MSEPIFEESVEEEHDAESVRRDPQVVAVWLVTIGSLAKEVKNEDRRAPPAWLALDAGMIFAHCLMRF